jgi:predicted ATPase
MARTIRSLHLDGFLSFGPESEPVVLSDLNVLIGPNGSGKSNLVDAFDVLRAAPGDLPVPIRHGGGVHDWTWKGPEGSEADRCTLEVTFGPGVIVPSRPSAPAVRYRLVFGAEGDRFTVLDERIENERPEGDAPKPYFYFGYENGVPMLNQAAGRRRLRREDIDPTQSILSQRKDPDTYPELTRVADTLRSISMYRSWSFGPHAPIRRASIPGERADRLNESLDNLPVRIGALKAKPQNKRRLLELMAAVSDGFCDVEVVPEGGLLQLYLTEGERNFPARRLSDGTLRILCLGAILLDPPQDSIIVIEEPELGLHPDLMPVVRDLLLEAARKAQIVVTTHSTVLADAFTDHAECVLICEKHDGQTHIRRLSQPDIDRWKADDGLGSLWMSGRLGGTRW